MASATPNDPTLRPTVRFPRRGFLGRLAPLPPIWLEGRLAAEFGALIRDPVWHGRRVPRGEGRPVILIPGFLAGDQSLVTMRDWFRRMEYRPTLSGIRVNIRYSEFLIEGLTARLREEVQSHGRKVAIVGHSRGGLLAKVVADRNPDLVDQVIALGSPLGNPYDLHPMTLASVHWARFYNFVRYGNREHLEGQFEADLLGPPVAPITSVYTRSDGIVHWRACIRPDIPAVEVRGSHSGLAHNAEVFHLLARLLAPARATAGPAGPQSRRSVT